LEHLHTFLAITSGSFQQFYTAKFVAIGHGFALALFAAVVALFARAAPHNGVVDVVGGH